MIDILHMQVISAKFGSIVYIHVMQLRLQFDRLFYVHIMSTKFGSIAYILVTQLTFSSVLCTFLLHQLRFRSKAHSRYGSGGLAYAVHHVT